jgi:hypothetical protein
MILPLIAAVLFVLGLLTEDRPHELLALAAALVCMAVYGYRRVRPYRPKS